MKVICAGLSKTGTKSMAKALRMLGYTVYDFFDHVDFHYNEFYGLHCLGKLPDFAFMYKDVDATTDLPAAFWYEEIFQAFPDAKVVLTVRDNEDVWVKSFTKQKEILQRVGCLVNFILRRCITRTSRALCLVDLMWMAAFGTLRIESTFLSKKKYCEHNERVQAVIPKEKLLVFNVKQGWKPLCEFLECEVPDQPFPRENVSGSFSKDEISKALQKFFFEFLIGTAVFMVVVSAVLVCWQTI